MNPPPRWIRPCGLWWIHCLVLTVWATSWATMRVTISLFSLEETPGSYRSAVSRYSTSPQFSIAPPLKSGTAT